jgi:hypothetical protein
MNVRYWVELSQAERGELTAMLSQGKRPARKLKRAQILLAADAGCSDEEIARTVAVGGSTGKSSGGTDLDASGDTGLTPNDMRPFRSSITIIWWTAGGLT